MKQQVFDIELKQPVIISQQAATVGAHQSLDYISGSALLGLVASRLYATLNTEDAFLLFHSGKVRFLDALPVEKQNVAYPIPFSLHAFKAEKYSNDQGLIAEKIFDVSQLTPADLKEKQPVQLRGFYLTESGERVTPKKEQTLKTAIDAKYNRAAESQLFGYEALSLGQEFRFSVQADADVTEDLWKKVIDALQGSAHLGRSRSAQFGRVQIQKSSKAYHLNPSVNNSHLTLWLLSDLYLQNQGQPTLEPMPELLGLPKGTTWLVEKSFLRSRRYSSYNAYRKHYDKERQVIARGSVLRYELPESFTDFAALQQKLSQGIGLYIESGLGQVSINPSILAGKNPVWSKVSHTPVKSTLVHKEPTSTLISTLRFKMNAVNSASDTRTIATKIFSELCNNVSYARRYHAIAKGTAFDAGRIPTRTQFGRFKEVANQYRNDKTAIWHELSNLTNGILVIREEGEGDIRQRARAYQRSGWELKFGIGAKDQLGTWLKDELYKYKNESYFSQILAELALFGLGDEWEQCCLGMADKKDDKQHGEPT